MRHALLRPVFQIWIEIRNPGTQEIMAIRALLWWPARKSFRGWRREFDAPFLGSGVAGAPPSRAAASQELRPPGQRRRRSSALQGNGVAGAPPSIKRVPPHRLVIAPLVERRRNVLYSLIGSHQCGLPYRPGPKPSVTKPMTEIRLALLRGVCQMPAYVAHTKHFADQNLHSRITIAPSAWLIPEQLCSGKADFAVIPWTRVAAGRPGEAPLKVICGSGIEEAAIVVRSGLTPEQVSSVAVPREGGMKDLTAMGLLDSLGWTRERVKHHRFPSGDGAIICLFGNGADASSMVEPYAAMMEETGVGHVVRRTGDLWPGAPGCSLATSAAVIERDPDLVQRVVNAYVDACAFVTENPDTAAEIGAPFIGVHAQIVRRALQSNRPNVDAIRNAGAIEKVLRLMQELKYIDKLPEDFIDLQFLDRAQHRT